MLKKMGLGRAASVTSVLRTLARSAPQARGISRAVGDQARDQVAVRSVHTSSIPKPPQSCRTGGRDQEMPG